MATSVIDGAHDAITAGAIGGKGKGKIRPPPPPKAKAKPKAEGYTSQPQGAIDQRKMPPLPKPAADEALVKIAKLQCDDGSWHLSDELAAALGLYPSALALSPSPAASVPSWDRLVATSTARQALERCRSILNAQGHDRDETLEVAGAASVLGAKLLDAAIEYLDARWQEVSEAKHLVHLYARQRHGLDRDITKLLDQQLPRPDWQAQLKAKMSVQKTCEVCGSTYTAAVAKCLTCFPPERPAEPEARKEDSLHDWQKLTSAPVNATLDWSPEGMKPCEGGSGGVALFKLPQGVVVVKPQKMTAGAEFLAIQVAKTIAVPVADIRVVRWVDAEYAAIRDILRSAPPGKEQDLTMLALRLQHRNSEFFGILEFVPGIGVQGQELHERLEAMTPDRLDSFWYQVGEIVAFDALINNLDRVPLLWDNEGNTANLMLREDNGGVAVVGIDQAVTAIVAEGPGRERYAARLRVLAEGVFTGSWKEQAASQVLPSTTRGGTWSISTGMAHVTECFQLCCGATVHWEAFMAGLRFRLNHIADLADDGSLGTALDEATAAADQIFRAATVDVGFRQLGKMQEFLIEMASVIAETRRLAAAKDAAA